MYMCLCVRVCLCLCEREYRKLSSRRFVCGHMCSTYGTQDNNGLETSANKMRTLVRHMFYRKQVV